jgi:hypothetical protein
MLSSLSLSRSIAVWKVNFQVRWVVCNVVIRHTRLKFTLTLTRPCQFARLAFPAFKAERIRGIFLIPPSWLCIMFAMSRFSGRVKHSTALWREFMTSRDSEGRRSHVRRSERPSFVLVLSSVPNVSRQPKMQQCVGVGLERGPNSDNPSLVFVEWIDAWLSFSNTCKELTAHRHHHERASYKGEKK